MYKEIFFFFIIFKLSFLEGSISNKNEYKKISTVNEDYCRCSGPLPKSRVINGTRVIGFDYEWVVGIYSQSLGRLICTGSLISASTVLTSAHCADDDMIDDLQVLAGFIYDWRDMVKTDWGSRKIVSIKLHPDAENDIRIPYKNDIAIYQLDKDFVLGFNNSIYLACILENEIKNPKNLDYFFAGYGIVKPFYLDLKTKKVLSPLVMSKSVNHVKFKYDENNCRLDNRKDYSICLNQKDGSVCNIDSGGPVHTFIGEKLALVSVLSSVRSPRFNETVSYECSKGLVNYSVKVSKHLDFIKENGNPKCLISEKNL